MALKTSVSKVCITLCVPKCVLQCSKSVPKCTKSMCPAVQCDQCASHYAPLFSVLVRGHWSYNYRLFHGASWWWMWMKHHYQNTHLSQAWLHLHALDLNSHTKSGTRLCLLVPTFFKRDGKNGVTGPQQNNYEIATWPQLWLWGGWKLVLQFDRFDHWRTFPFSFLLIATSQLGNFLEQINPIDFCNFFPLLESGSDLIAFLL